MDTADLLGKTERLAELEALLASPQWAIIQADIEKRIARQRLKACELGDSHAHRDGAAGAANELEDLLGSYRAQVAALSVTIDAARKVRRLIKQRTSH